MSHRGINGYMGSMGNEHPSTQKLIDIWNELSAIDGYAGSYREELPKHLQKLQDAIQAIRNNFIETHNNK